MEKENQCYYYFLASLVQYALCVGVSMCGCSLHTLLERFIQSDWRRDTAWIVDGEVTPLSLQRPPLQYIIILPCLSVNAS